VPQIRVLGVQRRAVLLDPPKGLLGIGVFEVDARGVLQRLDVRPRRFEVALPPLGDVPGRREGVVVLDELAVVDEILAEIEDRLDAVADLEGLLGVVDPSDVAVSRV